jgi:hypothetical protein
MTRRTFTAAAAAAFAYPLRAAPKARIEEVRTISADPGHYHGWATLARRKSGELLVAYSGGREAHVCPFGRVELIRSSGAGEQWSWPEVVMDTAIDDRDAGICETDKGSLLVTTFTSLAFQDTFAKAKDWPADKRAQWEAVNRRGTEKQFQSLLDTWMMRSTDGGLTWSSPYRVPLNSPHGPSPVSGGRLLYAGKQLWQPGKKTGVCESTDDGQTWRWLSDIPTGPATTARLTTSFTRWKPPMEESSFIYGRTTRSTIGKRSSASRPTGAERGRCRIRSASGDCHRTCSG